MSMKKTTKSLVGSAVMLGVGNAVINAIPNSGAVAPIMTNSANMIGVAGTAMYAKDTMNAMSGMSRPQRRRKKTKSRRKKAKRR